MFEPTERRVGDLRIVATRFRMAIEQCDPKQLTEGMEKFPTGSCGDAVLLLGTYLSAQGLGSFVYVAAWRRQRDGGKQSHAWLESDGIIIDITADQFSDVSEKIIVTRKSLWHQTFAEEKKVSSADFRAYDPHTISSLKRVYARVLEKMKRSAVQLPPKLPPDRAE